jgi:glycopeptide antibiotics resistance protein
MVRRLTGSIFLLYVAGVVALTIFPLRVQSAAYRSAEPWWTMLRLLPGDVDAPSFVLNLIMFIPLGVLLPLLRPAVDAYCRVAGLAVTASLAIEMTQFVLGITLGSRRTVDVNDLIANAAGALVGLLILRLAVPSRQHRARYGVRSPLSPSPPG